MRKLFYKSLKQGGNALPIIINGQSNSNCILIRFKLIMIYNYKLSFKNANINF